MLLQSTWLWFHSMHLRRKSWEIWRDTEEEETWKDSLHAAWVHLHFCSMFSACSAWCIDKIIQILLLAKGTILSFMVFPSRMFEFPAVHQLAKLWWDHHVGEMSVIQQKTSWQWLWKFPVGGGQHQGKGQPQTYLRVPHYTWNILGLGCYCDGMKYLVQCCL